MLIDLSEIVIRDGMVTRLPIDQPGVEDPNLDFAAPLQGSIKFINAIEILQIEGEVETRLRQQCARCLEPVEFDMKVQLQEAFPIEDIRHPGSRKSEDPDIDFVVRSVVYLDRGKPILDLDELLRQALLLELPGRVVCSEDCPGFCAGCGADLRHEACRCSTAAPTVDTESPFARLGALLKD